MFYIFGRGIQNSRDDKKNGNVADSATNLIFACCENSQFTKCTFSPRNDSLSFLFCDDFNLWFAVITPLLVTAAL